MRVEMKFCGLTREADAAFAADLGARFLGVIFAPSPRRLDADRARRVLDGGGGHTVRVGVFGASPAGQVGLLAKQAALHVAQLHADPTIDDIAHVRAEFSGEIWAALRVRGDALQEGWEAVLEAADAVVLDTGGGAQLGGTGTPFDWHSVSEVMRGVRGAKQVVLAGGLTATNVARAIETLEPNVVDVSSGVERAPGVKDHDAMRAFRDAVAAARDGAR